MRSVALVLAAAAAPQHAGAHCTSPLLDVVLPFIGASSLNYLPGALLGKLQNKCADGHCPTVPMKGCDVQSVDDLNCETPEIFSDGIKLGTDTICDAGCDDWPCKAGCDGLDVGICEGADFVLCKVGCLGIKPCVHNCEKAIVDPCKKKLINECSDNCEEAFHNCKSNCKKALTMEISADFVRLRRAVSSLSVADFQVDCSGNGVFKPLTFNATTSVHIDDGALELRVHTKDAGISSTNGISIDHLKLTLDLPISGSVQCGPFAHNIEITVGQSSVADFDLDVEMDLDKTLKTISSVICLNLPFCKDAIKDAISKGIRNNIHDKVPEALAKEIAPMLQELANQAKCPHMDDEELARAAAIEGSEPTTAIV